MISSATEALKMLIDEYERTSNTAFERGFVCGLTTRQQKGVLLARRVLSREAFQSFKQGDKVRKKGNKGQWHGVICGKYSTAITPEGYAVESVYEKGSVQIYPVNALEKWEN